MAGILGQTVHDLTEKVNPHCFRVARIRGSTSVSMVPATQVVTKKNWNDGAMESALQDIISGKPTIRHAALEYNVPKSTLHDRVSGKVLLGAVGGPL